LLGFASCDSGRVTVGNVDLAEVDSASWRSSIAWVPQRPYLFAGTIRANIALGRSDIPDISDIIRAAGAAGAHEFIASLPHGYDTVLGDDGAGLSSGQRQRIALARAFLRDAPLVLLDEPTANLDGATEYEVLGAVQRLMRGRTAIVVAHRPALVALADAVVDLTPSAVPA
jgi:ABC-type multidrug transport system fused ATPase/permease subunit